jgi:hypothetical protein
MKAFSIVLALTLAAAMSVPPASGVNVPTLGASPSMIEKVQNKPPRKRGKVQCYSNCIKDLGCALDIIGQCYAHCRCTCNARTPKQAKNCPDPT